MRHEQKAISLYAWSPHAELSQMPDGYAKSELSPEALESALEFVWLLEAGCYIPKTSQGKIILQLCDEIGNHIMLPGYKADS